MMTDNTTAQDPAAIERDIRRTQEEMSRTVDRIGDQLSPRNIVNSLLDRAESGNIDTRALIDGARRNPLALALIAGGTIWLLSENDAKLPAGGLPTPKMPSLSSLKPSRRRHEPDASHREYVSHMASVEWRDGEDPASYQRRRDIARANYFMLERSHDEDEGAFRQRLDQATEAFRSARHAIAEQGRKVGGAVSNTGRGVLESGKSAYGAAGDAGSAVLDRGKSAYAAAGTVGQNAMRKSQDLYTANPLVGGLISAAIGAAFGALLPTTQTEREKLGSVGSKARDLADEQKNKLADVVQGKKDEIVSRVEEKVQGSGQPSAGAGAEPAPVAVSSPTQPAFG